MLLGSSVPSAKHSDRKRGLVEAIREDSVQARTCPAFRTTHHSYYGIAVLTGRVSATVGGNWRLRAVPSYGEVEPSHLTTSEMRCCSGAHHLLDDDKLLMFRSAISREQLYTAAFKSQEHIESCRILASVRHSHFRGNSMNSIIWLVGAVVIVLAILSFFGLR